MASKEPESETSADVSTVRDAAKWLITAFAAVGAALLAGIQFSDIGQLEGGRLWVGIAGFGVGLFGVGIAIWSTSAVLVTRTVSLKALPIKSTQYLDKHRDIVGLEFASFADFLGKRDAAWHRWHTARPTDNKQVEILVSELEHLEEVATRVARFWRFEQVCRTFARARLVAFAGALIAAAGVVIFTIAAGHEDEGSLAKNPSAVAVTYRLDAAAHQALLQHVPQGCLQESGSATLLDGWPKGTDVLIVASSSNCSPLRLRWSDTLGTLVAAQTSTPPASTP